MLIADLCFAAAGFSGPLLPWHSLSWLTGQPDNQNPFKEDRKGDCSGLGGAHWGAALVHLNLTTVPIPLYALRPGGGP
jgi:hypothetical protein